MLRKVIKKKIQDFKMIFKHILVYRNDSNFVLTLLCTIKSYDTNLCEEKFDI